MSTRFWLFSGGTIAGAILMGLALGSFVTTQPRRGAADFTISDVQAETEAGYDAPAVPTQAAVEIRCKGCGSTLAERQRQKDMAGYDFAGLSDPVVQDYRAELEEPMAEPPPPPAHLLPLEAQRFASGGQGTPPPAVKTTVVTAPPTNGVAPPAAIP